MENTIRTLRDIDIHTSLKDYSAEELITKIYMELLDNGIRNCILTALVNKDGTISANNWSNCTYGELANVVLSVLSMILSEETTVRIKALILEDLVKEEVVG